LFDYFLVKLVCYIGLQDSAQDRKWQK